MKKEIEAFLELKNLVEKMNSEISCVIVEGRKDKEALEKIGYKGRIIYANKFEMANGMVVILTDFDKEGKEIAKRITRSIGEKNVDKFFRNEFKKILRSIGRDDIQSIINLCKKYEKMSNQNL
jgi:5S rRNA maturation endonuclease (ribonuclease M5)